MCFPAGPICSLSSSNGSSRGSSLLTQGWCGKQNAPSVVVVSRGGERQKPRVEDAEASHWQCLLQLLSSLAERWSGSEI